MTSTQPPRHLHPVLTCALVLSAAASLIAGCGYQRDSDKGPGEQTGAAVDKAGEQTAAAATTAATATVQAATQAAEATGQAVQNAGK
jgi:hypothetical protein